jgi:hypothetical protein
MKVFGCRFGRVFINIIDLFVKVNFKKLIIEMQIPGMMECWNTGML